ncbi:NinH [Providencia rettgeri]
MQAEITSIPELLVKHYGNMEAVSRELGVHWYTVRRHAIDFDMRNHIIVNGGLMTARNRAKVE